MKTITLSQLISMRVGDPVKTVRKWFLRREERHCDMCADVETQRAREHSLNASHYQKRAALARIKRRALG